MGAIVRKGNKGISWGQWGYYNGTIREPDGDHKGNNGAIAMGMPSAYVAQWENLERWYDIRGRRKRAEIVGTIDKGLGPRVQKHGLECRHVMRAG